MAINFYQINWNKHLMNMKSFGKISYNDKYSSQPFNQNF